MDEITPAQWAFAEKFLDDFKALLGRAFSEPRETHPLNRWLRPWCFFLGIMCLDTYGGMIELLRSENKRAAYILSRSLFDYMVRLTFYHLQARPLILDALKHPEHKHNHRELAARKDLKSGTRRLVEVTGFGEFSIDKSFTESERRAFMAALKSEARKGPRKYYNMLKFVAAQMDDPDSLLNVAMWQHQMRSLWAHGDAGAITDVLDCFDDFSVTNLHWNSQKIPKSLCLYESTFSMFVTLRVIAEVTGQQNELVKDFAEFRTVFAR